jgi:hypothetical protein
MVRYSHKTFLEGDLPDTTGVIFESCNFTGKLPNFYSCEFHGCFFRECVVKKVISCKLFSTNLVGCDLSRADFGDSITAPSSPCKVARCKWMGAKINLDCSFAAGIDFGNDEDAFLLMVMALIPISTHKRKMWESLPAEARSLAKRLLNRPFRVK